MVCDGKIKQESDKTHFVGIQTTKTQGFALTSVEAVGFLLMVRVPSL